MSSVLQYPNYTLGYRGTKAPDAPPSYGSYWAKITSIGGSISFGLTVYLILNSSTRTFVRTILNGAWVEHEWQEVVSPSIAQRTAALESAMLAVLGDGNNV